MRIVLVGASGFFGRYLLNNLLDDGHRCVVLTRAATRHGNLGILPGVQLVEADVYDTAQLARFLDAADAVVSMAGILNESGSNSFQKVHVELVETVIEASRSAGVTRILHVSALNAGKGESRYLETKGEAEAKLLSAEGLQVTIFQPSVIFGRGDQFFNKFSQMLYFMPIMPLTCPNARLQPVYAEDVAKAMTASLEDPMTWGKTYELAGPQSYTLKELVQKTAHYMGLKRKIMGLPNPVSAAMGAVMGLVPGKPFTLDNYRSLQTDNVTEHNGFAYFGIYPRSIETVVPDYLTGSVRQRRLQSFRKRSSD